MGDALVTYWPYVAAVATAGGAVVSWLVARLTARRELDHEMMKVAMTLLEPLEERVTTLEAENARLRERVRALESENVSLQAEVNELRGENEELRRMTAKPPRRAKGDKT